MRSPKRRARQVMTCYNDRSCANKPAVRFHLYVLVLRPQQDRQAIGDVPSAPKVRLEKAARDAVVRPL